MTGEYEVICTAAPDALVEKQLRETNRLEEEGKTVENPYGLIEQAGFSVEVIDTSDNINELYFYDAAFDYYDYSTEE